MKIAYVGNFEPKHSTENEILEALQTLDQDVTPFQENKPGCFLSINPTEYDFILWTHTIFPDRNPIEDEWQLLRRCRLTGIPTIGYHLDIWHGLQREHLLREEPFFNVDQLVTADGGHQQEFAELGINHVWMPPAVSASQCVKGTPKDEYKSDLAFIGSWQGHYHKESKHRHDLLQFLKAKYPKQVRFWPEPGQPAIRGEKLRDVIASTKIVVGDSCMADDRGFYWSDRIPETIGRGGFLLHPNVEGLNSVLDFTPKEHLDTWDAFNWEQLASLIAHYLEANDEREKIAEQGQKQVQEHHTYKERMEVVVGCMEDGGLIPHAAKEWDEWEKWIKADQYWLDKGKG